jgi:hypothetical protein
MANYQLKYQCTFDSLQSESYTIQILQKNYTGSAINVKGGATPVLHDWQTDDPMSPVKGSSLSITLINEGTLPLDSFYSVEDDEYQVILLWGAQVLFQGFLVQDDCSETMVDYIHEINLSANDNLGLLKSLTLDKAGQAFVYTSVGSISYTSTGPHSLMVDNVLGYQTQPGDKIKIVGGTANGIYTVLTVTLGVTTSITVVEDILSATGSEPMFIGKISLLDKKPLINIIGFCLQQTNLQLTTYVWGQINEVSQDQTKCFLEQTLVDPGTFMNDSTTYQDCYTILTNILSAFNFSLFQSLGSWHIVRWDELRYYNNQVTAYIYNYDMSFNGYAVMDVPFNAGINKTTFGMNGLLRRIIRPFSFDLETFNYKQPPQLLRNFDLKTLGTLLRNYTVNVWLWGGNTYYSYDAAVDAAPRGAIIISTYLRYMEYTAPFWYDSQLAPQVADYFIRVVLDNIDNEIERYMCAKNDNIKSYKIEANAGDIFQFSFSYRTQDYQSSGSSFITNVFIIELNDGVTRKFFKNTGWDVGIGFTFQVGPSDNTDTWHTVTIDTTHFPIPFDGLLYMYLSGTADLTGIQNFTYSKDIRLDYTPLINQTTKIIGQTHDTNQTGNIKNNNNSEIFIDSSPRNSIAGTLFLNEMVGVLQKRTVKWRHPYFSTESKNLGELVTFEQLFWRKNPRTIVEGTMYGLINNYTNPYGISIYITIDPLTNIETVTVSFTSTPPGTDAVAIGYFNGQWNYFSGSPTSPRTITIPGGIYPFVVVFTGVSLIVAEQYHNPKSIFSMLSIVRYSQFAGANFVSGKQTIDYKNNNFTGTLWEIWDDGEQDSELTDTYAFNYLYSPI